MTTINSICVKCRRLYSSTNGCCVSSDGTRSLISNCMYGGKNAGNRKTCRDFEKTSEDVIAARIACLKGEYK